MPEGVLIHCQVLVLQHSCRFARVVMRRCIWPKRVFQMRDVMMAATTGDHEQARGGGYGGRPRAARLAAQ